MTIEVVLIIIGLCLAVCYVVFEYQKTATPPYQEPIAPEPDLPEPTKTDTLDNIDKWNAKVGDKIWYKPDDAALTPVQLEQVEEIAEAELETTKINPQAAWPFPRGPKP